MGDYPVLLHPTTDNRTNYKTAVNSQINLGIMETANGVPATTSQSSLNTVTIDDQSMTEVPEGCEAIQKKLRLVIEHLAFRIFGFVLIIADIILTLVDFHYSGTSWEVHGPFDIAALCFVSYFFLEVNLRLVALGPRRFMKQWYNVIDYIVVIITLAITIVSAHMENFTEYAKLIIIGRLVRVVIFVRLFTERKQLEAGMRHLVSQNKRRYRKDGFDLDLTYVTDRVIAMSFPSSGKMAMYRNPIKEVAKFLDTKHPNHYKVYNLCNECFYDSKYFHDIVEWYPIEDHNPPLFRDLFRFTENVKEWLDLDPENIIAVHCKGGKGRTGTMVCVWLIESGTFESAMETLGYFGSRRTDLALGTKYQGVETPSQNRYVLYYAHVKENLNGRMPLEVTLKVEKIKICALKGVGKGDGSDFSCEIQNGSRSKIFSCEFKKSNTICDVHYSITDDIMEADLIDGPNIADDILVIFHCSSKSVPSECGDVAFFFWFHTAFVKQCKLTLKRDELDHVHKKKTWGTFREHFQVQLEFSYPPIR